jgi:hypothetical protein
MAKEVTAMATEQDGVRAAWSPAYVPFKTLNNLVVKMDVEGIPTRIDKSFLGHLSGGVQSHLFASMRSLGLIDGDRAPTEDMRELVTSGDERPAVYRRLLEKHYPWAVALGTTATHQQLQEAFTDNSPALSASTRDKALSFYLAAAVYAGVPLSKWFKTSTGSGSPRRAGPPRKKSLLTTGEKKSPTNTKSAQESAGGGNMRQQYFDMLIEKATAAETVDTDLLDRIEKLLSTEDATTKK